MCVCSGGLCKTSQKLVDREKNKPNRHHVWHQKQQNVTYLSLSWNKKNLLSSQTSYFSTDPFFLLRVSRYSPSFQESIFPMGYWFVFARHGTWIILKIKYLKHWEISPPYWACCAIGISVESQVSYNKCLLMFFSTWLDIWEEWLRLLW